MDFFDVIRTRHSIRAFSSQPVEDEKLQTILETINQAPSAGNLQGYEVFVVRNLEHRQALVKAALDQEFLAEAPLVLVFCANPSRSATRYGNRGIKLYSIQDATIACTYAMLAASALDLSTVWVGAFEEEPVSAALSIPAELIPVAMLPVGYGAGEPRNRPRRELSDLVHEVK